MKYGSTLRVSISSIWDDVVLKESFITLSEKPNAKAVLKKSFQEIEDWVDNTARALIKAQYLTDDDLLNIIRVRGLDKSSPVTIKEVPELYFIESKSGSSNGHYIELYSNRINCTCPGFKNYYKCWATTEVLKRISSESFYVRNQDKFSGQRQAFYNLKNKAYPEQS